MNSAIDSSNKLPANSEKIHPEKSDVVMQALNKLNQNSILLRLLWTLSCFILLLIAAIIILYSLEAGEVMYITGWATAALSLYAFHRLMKQIPRTFLILWERKIIASSPNQTEDLEKQYAKYVDDIRNLMNHHGQWAMGLGFTFLVLTWDYSSVIEFFIAFIIGLLTWRMAINSIKVWQLGKKFCLKPLPEHEDGCGGLEPLGNLCLWNALIVTIPGIFLGGWIIIGQSAKYSLMSDSYVSLAIYYTPLFFKLLWIPLTFAVISFFLPLWGVHRVMVSWREKKRRELDQLAYKINELNSEFLNQVDKLDPHESEKMAKKVELMQVTYQKNLHIPVWPFNTRIMVKFITSQLVPLLGLTGLGQPILKIIDSLMDFVK